MNTRYILPVCVAVAAHGALLLGFSKPPRPVKVVEPKPRYVPFHIVQPEDEPPVRVQPDDTSPARPAAPDLTMPRNAEPVRIDIDPGHLAIERPPMPAVEGPDIMRILETEGGIPGGTGTAPWSNGILTGAELDNTPRTRFQASPLYPFEAKRAGLRGEVHVDFVVDERGRVSDARIVSSTDRVFEEPTLRAVSRWQFEPGRRHGKIVKFRMMVPVVFNLNE